MRQTAPPSSGFQTHTFHSCDLELCCMDTTPCRVPSPLPTLDPYSHYTPRSSNYEPCRKGEPSAITAHSLRRDRHASQYCRSAMPTATAEGSPIADQS